MSSCVMVGVRRRHLVMERERGKRQRAACRGPWLTWGAEDQAGQGLGLLWMAVMKEDQADG